MPLTPSMEKVVAYRHLYPGLSVQEIADKIGMTKHTVWEYWRGAMTRLGRNEDCEGFELQVAVHDGKKDLAEVDRRKFAKRLMKVSSELVEGFERLTPERIDDMIDRNPNKVMLSAAIGIDKANMLEDRPTQRIEIMDHRKIDDALEAVAMELKQRRENTIDVTPESDVS